MHFLASCDENYLQYLKVLMVSIYANHPQEKELTFHILYRDLPLQSIKAVCAFAESYQQKANFIRMDETLYADILDRYANTRWPAECLYTLLAHRVLPPEVDRILAIDIDAIAVGDLSQFYSLDFDGCYLIASPEQYRAVDEKDPSESLSSFTYYTSEDIDPIQAAKGQYFNAGIVLYNVEKFRQDGIDADFYLDVIDRFSDVPIFFEQGILNAAFAHKTKFLNTSRYNYRLSFSLCPEYTSGANNHFNHQRQYTFTPVEDVRIIHYCGIMPTSAKPWDFCLEARDVSSSDQTFLWLTPECVDYFAPWWNYARMTPDFDRLWQIQQINKLVLKNLKTITLNTNLDFVNQAGLETLRAPVWRNINSIQENDDLNDYIIPRVYRCATGKIKTTLHNIPKEFTQSRGFRLTVKHISFESPENNMAKTALLQILEPNDPGAAIYRRHCDAPGSGKWGPWYKTATTQDIRPLHQQYTELSQRVEEQNRLFAEMQLQQAQQSMQMQQQMHTIMTDLQNAQKHISQTKRELDLLRSDFAVKTKALSDCQNRLKKEQERNASLKNSLSFRIGRAITLFPRKLRDLIKK